MADGISRSDRRYADESSCTLERLEPRLVLSTVTVTTLADEGPGSLRQDPRCVAPWAVGPMSFILLCHARPTWRLGRSYHAPDR